MKKYVCCRCLDLFDKDQTREFFVEEMGAVRVCHECVDMEAVAKKQRPYWKRNKTTREIYEELEYVIRMDFTTAREAQKFIAAKVMNATGYIPKVDSKFWPHVQQIFNNLYWRQRYRQKTGKAGEEMKKHVELVSSFPQVRPAWERDEPQVAPSRRKGRKKKGAR